MALDGIVISNLRQELERVLTDGRISKIAQPEKDELLLTIKNNRTQYRLLLSADASLPLIYLTGQNKTAPATAPNFCMLLRKHIANGKILSIRQPGLERVLEFEIEHLNEMGDYCRKLLIVEIMGKHSNIIFTTPDYCILDSIKHISAQTSSVREVLPGRTYFIPETIKKGNPLDTDDLEFCERMSQKPVPLAKAIYSSYTGISPTAAEEICHRAMLESSRGANTYLQEDLLKCYHCFHQIFEEIKQGIFYPTIVFDQKTPVEFASIRLTMYEDLTAKAYESISEILEYFYAAKNASTRIHQKSSDLRKILTTVLERNQKKYDLQAKQMKDTEKRDQYRIYGELLNTYGYNVKPGSKYLEACNYYTGEDIKIPLDSTLTPQENAKRYFDKYNKLKRTYEALTDLLEETSAEIIHIESILTAMDIAESEDDLIQIKEEMIQSGLVRRKGNTKKIKIRSKPFHYLSSDGFHIYVGKNNLQNDELTFKFANGGDWWFHAKGAPGSHVVLRTEGRDVPDRAFEEAGRLAAYYSKNRHSPKVEIDYIQRRQVKKPNGSKPGFVVYYTNYSFPIEPDISSLTLLSEQ